VMAIEAFWPKMSLYVFHYAGYALGLLGMIAQRQRWRQLFPLYGLVVYITAIHMALLALPRYVFPTYPAFWLFAAALVAGVLAGQDESRAAGRHPSAVRT
jgi:hypothetical protein